VLWEMGKLDLAGKYFSRLLEQLPSSDPLLSSLYEDLGKLASQTGDYDMSMQWHQKSLAIKNKNQLTDNSISKYIEREPIFFKRASYMTSNILSSKIILVKLGREESLEVLSIPLKKYNFLLTSRHIRCQKFSLTCTFISSFHTIAIRHFSG
ncbi:MAG: tetratricopeptide repeat protein, partial [Ignavibacteria bacterium]|nr:tetratricopeptide repeat protein [Ignavibacteria bacterium]